MKNKFYVSRYVPYSRRYRKRDNFISKLVAVTSVVSLVLISVSVILLTGIPDEAFVSLLSSEPKTQFEGYVYPKPTDEVRIKADRLREIRYEDYLEHCYTPLDGEMDNVYINDNKKKCYLTFDDGPSSVTPMILDVLKQYKVRATFFVLGIHAESNPEIIRQMHSEGHAIGNHSYSHEYDRIYDSVSGFKNEIKKCQNAIDEALGTEYGNSVFRFPGGYASLTNEDTKYAYRNALTEMGYKYIDWSCLTGDSNTTAPTEEYLMNTLKFGIGDSKTGDIVVLMHDSPTKEITAKALPKIIEYLYDEGYEFDVLTNKRQ